MGACAPCTPACRLPVHSPDRKGQTHTRSIRVAAPRQGFQGARDFKTHTLASRWRFGLQNFSANTWKAYIWAPGLTQKRLANNSPGTPTLPSKG